MYTIGHIDVEKYQKVADGEIITDEVIITDERIQHIVERRGQAFIDEYFSSFSEILSDPDYIFRDKRKNSAIACKSFEQNGKAVNLVIRLAVEDDDPIYRNSIITAIKESDKRFAQRIRNNRPVYKRK